ncbi:putative kynureninase [Podospora fimiseda]|uniref:Kynureninase n=1 Tax=Podospora fimiseda TaxID=252190 RepID=A0AAN7BJ58_9PEZI|nr:putative kynureninase [Podospora fimiseda]
MGSLISEVQEGGKPTYPPEADTLEYARLLDSQDKLSHLRDEFIIPTRDSLKKTALDGTIPGETTNDNDEENKPCIYFVGNSLGCQPKKVKSHLSAQLETWASIGVNGHFTSLDSSPLTAWQDLAESCATRSLDIVGASIPEEIIYMNTLTVNLHLILAAFYQPTEKRHKIIIEWKPFPSDWYAVQSQIELHNLSVEESLVEIEPDDQETLYLSTEKILATIDQHADSTAILLLPGIQYFTGQLFDIPTITAYAQQKGIIVGWDLAHAAGNVPLKLHDWGVDFAVWCTYKYLNAGPGATAGMFLHEKHFERKQQKRLAGWYGVDKKVRFNMEKEFKPAKGAWGYQLSNPSATDLSCLNAALEVFGMSGGMEELRGKSVLLTGYLEWLLKEFEAEGLFKVLTPGRIEERGTQLSLMFKKGVLERVGAVLKENGVVIDLRKPDVIRVAPVPIYCRFEDVWEFVQVLRRALKGL